MLKLFHYSHFPPSWPKILNCSFLDLEIKHVHRIDNVVKITMYGKCHVERQRLRTSVHLCREVGKEEEGEGKISSRRVCQR